LQLLMTNRNVVIHEIGEVVKSTVSVTQQLSATVLFNVVFFYTLDGSFSAEWIVLLDVALLLCGAGLMAMFYGGIVPFLEQAFNQPFLAAEGMRGPTAGGRPRQPHGAVLGTGQGSSGLLGAASGGGGGGGGGGHDGPADGSVGGAATAGTSSATAAAAAATAPTPTLPPATAERRDGAPSQRLPRPTDFLPS
jgi:hypothetical protein